MPNAPDLGPNGPGVSRRAVKDMTVRASYGIFYAQDEGTGMTNRLTSNPPFFGHGSVTTSSD